MTAGPADLLMLNCTNYPKRPVYPYAFVQVSEVARRSGLSVHRTDLYGLDRTAWADMLMPLLAEVRPRMIGLHLRQIDSLVVQEYIPLGGRGEGPPDDYFPGDDTRQLVRLLREMTEAPIAVGGFGFTAQPLRLMHYLGADLGVAGGPDEFLPRFDEVVAGRDLGRVPGLLYRNGNEVVANPRSFYSPAPEIEYTDDVIRDVIAFYDGIGRNAAQPEIAIEVMRGCPYHCCFCTEPAVKGNQVRHRALDVVVDEIERLLRYGLSKYSFVCSELNIGGSRFAVELAERMIRLNEGSGAGRIQWTAYILPTIGPDALSTLFRSGFHLGGANDPLSLDDDNLARAKVPYRSRHVIAYTRRRFDEATSMPANVPQSVLQARRCVGPFDDRLPLREPSRASLARLRFFFGNRFIGPETVATTLRRLHDEGLLCVAENGAAIAATRVFDTVWPYADLEQIHMRSIHRAGLGKTDLSWPTFEFPPALQAALGSPAAVWRLLSFVSATMLSIKHRFHKHWGRLAERLFAASEFETLVGSSLNHRRLPLSALDLSSSISALLEACIDPIRRASTLKHLRADHRSGSPADAAAGLILAHVFRSHPQEVTRVLTCLDLQHDEGFVSLTEYEIMRLLYARFDSRGELTRTIEQELRVGPDSLERCFLEYLLYANGVVIHTPWRSVLFGDTLPGFKTAASASEGE